jgi:hypothetical protein
MYKKIGLMTMAGAVSLGMLGCAAQKDMLAMKQGPSFVVTTPVAELKPGQKLMMYGTGFAPKQEVVLLLKDPNGGMSSIGSSLKPAPVANADGAWAAQWDYSSFVRVIKPGTAMLTAADKDYKPLGQAPVAFIAPTPPKAPAVAGRPEARPGEARPAGGPPRR